MLEASPRTVKSGGLLALPLALLLALLLAWAQDCTQVSADGVAVPRTTGQFANCPRHSATVRAW